MKRYRQYGQLDDVPQVYGDMAFDALDMKTDPATLPQGTVQVSENMRFDANGTKVRGGIARQFIAGTAIGTCGFCGIYKPVAGNDQLAFLTRHQLYLFDSTAQSLTAYPYPAGETVEVDVHPQVLQAGIGAAGTLPKLYILRGQNQSVLRFEDGAIVVDSDVPPADFGAFIQNRLAVNNTSQSLKVSDFLAFGAGHWAVLNQFQIEKGGSDYLVGLMPYQKDYVLIASRKKWFLAYFDPNLGTASPYSGPIGNGSFLRVLTMEGGAVGPEAMLESGGLIWFVSDNGIFAFQPQLDNQLTVLGRPLSADILPIFLKLNASYARSACIVRYGYRLYFALPVSDEPIGISAMTVTSTATVGADLPQDLPFNLAAGGLATVTTAAPHGCSTGENVLITGVAAGTVNGAHEVMAVTDEYTLTVAIESPTGVILGARAMLQRVNERNNIIAVFNLNNRTPEHPLGSWESIDTMPPGFYADWLRVADFGAQRRLWVIDRENGPALYEEGEVDEIGDVTGGINVPFDLPVDLAAANFASTPIPGRIVTRAYRWSGDGSGFAYVRRVRACEVRLDVSADDRGTVICRVRTPDQVEIEASKTFTGTAAEPDVAVFQRINRRGLEAEVEITATDGRHSVRSVEVQVMKSGEY